MIKYFSVFVLVVFSFGRASAEDNSTVVQGEVTAEGGARLDYYNVVIERLEDSTVMGGSCFYTTRFELRIPHTDNGARLRITSLGYKDCYRKLEHGAATIDLGKITLTPETLEEVVVRPRTITNAGAKATVQVEGTVLQHMATVTDILQRAPMVTATNDALTVFGKGTPLIYIDGKIADYDAVKQLQPSQIVSMQVDRNPSARYDATYRSVLKVTTSRKREGISGQLYNYSYFGREYSNIAGGYLQINKGRWSNYLGTSHTYSNNRSYSDDVDAVDYAGYKLTDSTSYTNRYGSHRYNIEYGTTFKVSDKQSLSWQYDFSYSKDNGHNRSRAEERIYENAEATRLHSERTTLFSRPTHKANLQYIYQISEKKKLELTADYGHLFDNTREKVVRTTLPDSSVSEISVSSESRSDVFSAMAEYTFPLWDADVLAGGRYNRVASDVASAYDEAFTSTRFRNNVMAVYATVDRDYNKWGFSLGLRGEFSKDDVRANSEAIRNRWSRHIFPSASIRTDGLFEATDLSLSYRSSITHPSLWALNPASSYVNSVIIRQGNPLLDSEVNHNVELSATLWKVLTLTAGYDYYKNNMMDTGVLDDAGKHILFRPVNIPKSHEYTLMVAFNKQWAKFSLSAEGGIGFPYSRIPYLDSWWTNNKTSYSGSVNFDLRLSPTTLFTGLFYATSRTYELMTIWEPTYRLSFSLSQQLFKKRMTVIVAANDLLRRAATDWSDHYGYFESSSRASHDTRNVRIILRYNFNGDKNKFRGRTNSNIYDRVN